MLEWTAERAGWVVVDGPPNPYAFVCRRCGAAQPFEVPVALVDWTGLAQRFCERHATCKARPSEPTDADAAQLPLA